MCDYWLIFLFFFALGQSPPSLALSPPFPLGSLGLQPSCTPGSCHCLGAQPSSNLRNLFLTYIKINDNYNNNVKIMHLSFVQKMNRTMIFVLQLSINLMLVHVFFFEQSLICDFEFYQSIVFILLYFIQFSIC